MAKKGKKKGKKGGKGKKSAKGKQGPKSEKAKLKRDADVAVALQEATLFSNRLTVSEKERDDYREKCKKLASDNDRLHDTIYQSERDTIDVVKFLKKTDITKDEMITELQEEIREYKKKTRNEKEDIIAGFNDQIEELESRLEQRGTEVHLMQSELKLVKEFRQKRADMQNELDDIREKLFYAHKDHRNTMQKLEHKFFEEKVRLEREANQKIAELAERAQTEAVTNLDHTTRFVYNENVKLNDELTRQIQKSRRLQSKRDFLSLEVQNLSEVHELNCATTKRKIVECKRRKQDVHSLKEKVNSLEKALSSMVVEFREEKVRIAHNSKSDMFGFEEEIRNLQEMLIGQDRDLKQVKTISKRILGERKSVEDFFLSALERVRNEIAVNRRQYVEAARDAYNRKMRAAHSGQGEFPRIRTFVKSDFSTNDVFCDLSEAENWTTLGPKVDISDLTWEQKEKMLQLLFARMNGVKSAKRAKNPPVYSLPSSQLSIANKTQNLRKKFEFESQPPKVGVEPSTTFITQQEPQTTSLPSIVT